VTQTLIFGLKGLQWQLQELPLDRLVGHPRGRWKGSLRGRRKAQPVASRTLRPPRVTGPLPKATGVASTAEVPPTSCTGADRP